MAEQADGAAAAVRRALMSMAETATLMEQAEAVGSLQIYARNLLEHPDDDRYYRVRISNIHYHERLGHLEADHGLMAALGFEPDDDYLVWDAEARPPSDEGVRAGLLAVQEELKEREAEVADAFARLPPRLDEANHTFVAVQGAASHCDQGKRHNMEDDDILVDTYLGSETTAYFGLYDGHGGRETVDFVVKALHTNLAKLLTDDPEMDVREAYTIAYTATDGQVRRASILQSGTTAVSCLIRVDPGDVRTLYTANVGDSRAVLVRGGKAVRLTIDHKPNLPEEEKRIKDSGGFVIDKRVNGVLAISRALGDHMLKVNEVVSAVPYCQTVPLATTDTHLILACDGVWDVMTDQNAVDFVLDRLNKLGDAPPRGPALNARLKDVTAALVNEALARKSMDNVSAIVIKL